MGDHANIDHTGITGVSGDITADDAWAAKGDLIAGTGDGTAAILTAGTNGHVLTLDDGEATGMKWAAGGAGITEHAYVTGTSSVTVSSESEASPTSVISTSSIDVGSGAIDIEFFCYSFRVADGVTLVLNLWEGSTDKGRIALIQNGLSGDGNDYIRNAFTCKYRYTPGSGAKTFSIRAWQDSSGQDPLLGAGAGGTGTALPMFLRITSAP